MLQAGEIPIYEPGVGDLISKNKDRLAFTLDLDEALAEAEVVYVCVDTPPTSSGMQTTCRVCGRSWAR